MASGHESDLAWDLADRYSDCFAVHERANTYMHLGAGDYLAAIGCVLDAVARQDLALSVDTIARLENWVQIYDREQGFRAALARVRCERTIA
jgi:hypothetical protein